MQRYPEADLTGEIIAVDRHTTIPTVTVLRVHMDTDARNSTARIYVFEKMLDVHQLEGRCLRADVLPLPQNDADSDESGALIAMEWCIHEKDGTTVECSPGWSNDESGHDYIRITPPQA